MRYQVQLSYYNGGKRNWLPVAEHPGVDYTSFAAVMADAEEVEDAERQAHGMRIGAMCRVVEVETETVEEPWDQ